MCCNEINWIMYVKYRHHFKFVIEHNREGLCDQFKMKKRSMLGFSNFVSLFCLYNLE